jgi:hypothetical protein
MRALVFATLWCSWVLGGCGGEDHEASAYSSFQACFDVHAEDEGMTAVDAIFTCCLDHPIEGQRPACGASSSACVNYLTNNLKQTSASYVDLQDACYYYEGEL